MSNHSKPKTDERVILALELLATKLLVAESEIASLKTELKAVTRPAVSLPDSPNTGQYL